MNPILIGRKRLSDIVWGIIDEKVGDFPFEIIEKIVEEQQSLRSEAEYKTGSVPYDDAIELYKITKFFQPNTIAEVGTFIGVSTLTMNLALERLVDIYTCDMSNAIDLDTLNIHQYPKTASPDMFKDLAQKETKIDLVYLDGRLSQNDIEPLSKIIHADTVFVFDDFEGVEKGVVNAMMVESFARALIYPREGRKTAISVPFSLLQIVPQEAT
jgi:predicted O-methyltransferase YrrM